MNLYCLTMRTIALYERYWLEKKKKKVNKHSVSDTRLTPIHTVYQHELSREKKQTERFRNPHIRVEKYENKHIQNT